ncbi:TFIIB-type zinc ribbon-containing protein [Halodesulfovibrio spirochaetisodalis]|uniref:Transcription factor zinc-finger domain-containing protein n=1 Tax=Halodesulfovibrio spirochaetisodalis TaxID=1560234 RepID=A0A1B7XQ38_9BACT|nr:zf-TFIIB domain-containing protein [Halodesulfovibrio spirochaetisodalis]OBQ57613.1 hypothetical protein SP90_00780 [Halodesulfovibrio spirochaetisodalis]
MQCPNCETALTIINRKGIDIECCTTCDGVWMEQKEMDRLLQQMLSKKLTDQKPKRRQCPSISPTSEEHLAESGNDYGTYFTYKYHGCYGFPNPRTARTNHLLIKS